MPRTLLSVSLAFALATVGFAQDKKVDKPPPDFFPLAKGTKWEYVVKGAEKYPWEHEVTEVSEPKKGERAVATLTSTIFDRKRLVGKYSADEKAVYEHTRGGDDLDTPLVMLKLPVKAGSKWTEKFKYVGDVTADYEVKEAEEVKTPAGTFTAYPVVQSIKTTLGKSTVTNWYAEGIGMVKQEIRAFGEPEVTELKSFTPAK